MDACSDGWCGEVENVLMLRHRLPPHQPPQHSEKELAVTRSRSLEAEKAVLRGAGFSEAIIRELHQQNKTLNLLARDPHTPEQVRSSIWKQKGVLKRIIRVAHEREEASDKRSVAEVPWLLAMAASHTGAAKRMGCAGAEALIVACASVLRLKEEAPRPPPPPPPPVVVAPATPGSTATAYLPCFSASSSRLSDSHLNSFVPRLPTLPCPIPTDGDSVAPDGRRSCLRSPRAACEDLLSPIQTPRSVTFHP